MAETHQELCDMAIWWLYKQGCFVFAQEVPTYAGVADALGVRLYRSPAFYYIEAKASRSDLICEKQQRIYKQSLWGSMPIDFFYLYVAKGIVVEPNLYPAWGVIQEGKVSRKAKRMVHESPHTDQAREKLIHAIAHRLVYQVFGKLYMSGTYESHKEKQEANQ